MRFIFTLFLLFISSQSFAISNTPHKPWSSWPKRFIYRLHQVWTEGNNELYVTGYAWHNRFTYPADRIATYNEQAWGGGWGKGFYDEKGNWHGLSAFAFLDSHKNLEPAAGYAFIKMHHFNENSRIGLGYSIIITQRRDIFNGIPFAGVLPWLLLSQKRLAIGITYIPGPIKTTAPVGNVVFIIGKWTF